MRSRVQISASRPSLPSFFFSHFVTWHFFEFLDNASRRGEKVCPALFSYPSRPISADTLNFDPSGNFTGNTNTKSSQSFNSFDTAGGFYTCSLASASNALTSVSKGCRGEISK